MKQIQNAIVAVVALVAFVVGVSFYQSETEKTYSPNTYVYQPARPLADFNLVDQHGEPFTEQELLDKWSFVFLGYLSCPDICPMTMSKFSRLIPELNELPDVESQVLFVSVDPKRDEPENIRQYVEYFHQDVVGLRAEHKDLFPFVRSLGLMYSIPPSDQEEGYFVDHSASVILINPEGQIAAIFKPKVELKQVPTIDTKVVLSDFMTLLE